MRNRCPLFKALVVCHILVDPPVKCSLLTVYFNGLLNFNILFPQNAGQLQVHIQQKRTTGTQMLPCGLETGLEVGCLLTGLATGLKVGCLLTSLATGLKVGCLLTGLATGFFVGDFGFAAG